MLNKLEAPDSWERRRTLLSQLPHPHPGPSRRAVARAGFLGTEGTWQLVLGGTVKGRMTAILLQPISERCRPLTPVRQRTELKEKKKSAFLPLYLKVPSVCLGFYKGPKHCWDEGWFGIPPPGPQSHLPPPGQSQGKLRRVLRQGAREGVQGKGLFRGRTLKPPPQKAERLLQRVGNSCPGPRFAQAFSVRRFYYPKLKRDKSFSPFIWPFNQQLQVRRVVIIT